MGWLEILGYIASGAVFITFWMRTLIPLRGIGIASNILFLSYGLSADLTSIALLHATLLPLNCLRLYQAYELKRRIHKMAHLDFDVKSLLPMMSPYKLKTNDYVFNKGDQALDILYG